MEHKTHKHEHTLVYTSACKLWFLYANFPFKSYMLFAFIIHMESTEINTYYEDGCIMCSHTLVMTSLACEFTYALDI